MALLLRNLGRQALLQNHKMLYARTLPQSTTAYKEMQEFWEKNRRLNRPLSPHLSIYSPQLTSMLSLCHRATGIAMAVTISGVSITLLCLPGTFATYLTMVNNLALGPAIITALKYLIAFPVTYHYINGIRHLAWDWALGCGMKETYRSGYFVMSLALMVTAGFVHLF